MPPRERTVSIARDEPPESSSIKGATIVFLLSAAISVIVIVLVVLRDAAAAAGTDVSVSLAVSATVAAFCTIIAATHLFTVVLEKQSTWWNVLSYLVVSSAFAGAACFVAAALFSGVQQSCLPASVAAQKRQLIGGCLLASTTASATAFAFVKLITRYAVNEAAFSAPLSSSPIVIAKQFVLGLAALVVSAFVCSRAAIAGALTAYCEGSIVEKCCYAPVEVSDLIDCLTWSKSCPELNGIATTVAAAAGNGTQAQVPVSAAAAAGNFVYLYRSSVALAVATCVSHMLVAAAWWFVAAAQGQQQEKAAVAVRKSVSAAREKSTSVSAARRNAVARDA